MSAFWPVASYICWTAENVVPFWNVYRNALWDEEKLYRSGLWEWLAKEDSNPCWQLYHFLFQSDQPLVNLYYYQRKQKRCNNINMETQFSFITVFTLNLQTWVQNTHPASDDNLCQWVSQNKSVIWNSFNHFFSLLAVELAVSLWCYIMAK